MISYGDIQTYQVQIVSMSNYHQHTSVRYSSTYLFALGASAMVQDNDSKITKRHGIVLGNIDAWRLICSASMTCKRDEIDKTRVRNSVYS